MKKQTSDSGDLGLQFFEELLSGGKLEKQTEAPQPLKGVSELRKTFSVEQLYAKKFDTKGWSSEMVLKLQHNLQTGYEAFCKKSTQFMSAYYQRKIDAGLPGFGGKKIEEINIPSAEEIRNTFDLRPNSFVAKDGEVVTVSIEMVWIKPVIEALGGFWDELIKDGGGNLTKTVRSNGKRKEIEISTSPEYRVLCAKRFDDPEEDPANPKIGKKGLTLRFLIPDAGNHTGFCDVWLGKQFIPSNNIVKRRPRQVAYEGEPEMSGEFDHPHHTNFYPYDYKGRVMNYRRHVRWSNSWIQVVFDYKGLRESVQKQEDGSSLTVINPVWDVSADGQKIIFIPTGDGDKKRPQTVAYFARSRGEQGKSRLPNEVTGSPVDIIAWIFGGEEKATIGGQERTVQKSGNQIVFDLGFIADYWTISDLIENAEKFASGEKADLSSPWFLTRQVLDKDTYNLGEIAEEAPASAPEETSESVPNGDIDDEEE